jgi:hypothetical protein
LIFDDDITQNNRVDTWNRNAPCLTNTSPNPIAYIKPKYQTIHVFLNLQTPFENTIWEYHNHLDSNGSHISYPHGYNCKIEQIRSNPCRDKFED